MRFGWILAALCAVAMGGGPGLGRAIELPAKAQALRDQGVPAAEVASAVKASKDHGLTAAEATDVLDAAKDAKLDNLGSFVKSKLDEGLRGRELAQAIHEEQARRGMGKPDEHGGPPDGKGPDGDKGGKSPDAGEGKEGKGQGKAPDGADKGDKAKSGKGGH